MKWDVFDMTSKLKPASVAAESLSPTPFGFCCFLFAGNPRRECRSSLLFRQMCEDSSDPTHFSVLKSAVYNWIMSTSYICM